MIFGVIFSSPPIPLWLAKFQRLMAHSSWREEGLRSKDYGLRIKEEACPLSLLFIELLFY